MCLRCHRREDRFKRCSLRAQADPQDSFSSLMPHLAMQAIPSYQVLDHVLVSFPLSYALEGDERAGKVLSSIIFPSLREASRGYSPTSSSRGRSSFLMWLAPLFLMWSGLSRIAGLSLRSIVQVFSYELNIHRLYLSSTRSSSEFPI